MAETTAIAQLLQALQAQQQGQPAAAMPLNTPAAASSQPTDVEVAIPSADFDYELQQEDLRSLMAVFGQVLGVSVNPMEGSATVTFAREESALEAVRELNGVWLRPYSQRLGVRVVSGPTTRTGRPSRESAGASASAAGGGGDGGQGKGRKQMCRLELVDVFGQEPEFNITLRMLGDNNSNILHILNEAWKLVDIHIKGTQVPHTHYQTRNSVCLCPVTLGGCMGQPT